MCNFLRTLGSSLNEGSQREDSKTPIKSYEKLPDTQVIGRWKNIPNLKELLFGILPEGVFRRYNLQFHPARRKSLILVLRWWTGGNTADLFAPVMERLQRDNSCLFYSYSQNESSIFNSSSHCHFNRNNWESIWIWKENDLSQYQRLLGRFWTNKR